MRDDAPLWLPPAGPRAALAGLLVAATVSALATPAGAGAVAARGAADLRPGEGRGHARSTGARTATPRPGRWRCRADTPRPASQPWKGGDNGGATAPGVTKDTITIALYQAQPDLLQQAFFEQSGSDESLAKERETTQEYVDYFSAHYELYGRKVKLVTGEGERRPRRRRRRQGRRDQGRDRGARVRVVRWSGSDHRVRRRARRPGRALRRRLRHRRAAVVPRSVTRPTCGPPPRPPSRRASTGRRSSGRSSARKKAVHAGSPDLTSKVRRFGVVHYDDDAGTFAKSVEALRAAVVVVQGEGGRDRAVLARPDHRATGRPQRDRQAQELRRDERAPRRRPGVPDVPHQGGDRAELLPRVGGARVRVHRHRGVRSPVRPEAVGARVRRVAAPRPHRRRRRRARQPHHVADRPPARGEDVPRARAGAAGVLHRRAPRRPAAHRQVLRRRPRPVPVRTDHHADAPAPVVGSPRHLEGRRPHRRRRRHRDLVGPERGGPRRGGPRRQGPVPLRRRRPAVPPRAMADDAGRVVRPQDLDDRAHHAATGRRAPDATRRRPVRSAVPSYAAAAGR